MVAIEVEIARQSLEATVDGVEIALFYLVVALVEIDVNAVVIFQNHRVIGIVATGIDDIQFAIAIHVGQIETVGTIHRHGFE